MTSSRDKLTPEDAARMSVAEQYEWFRARRSRRAVIRGGLAGAGALAAGPLLATGAAAATTGATTRRAAPAVLLGTDKPAGSLIAPAGRHINFGAAATSQATRGSPTTRWPPATSSWPRTPRCTCTRATSATPRTAATGC